mmetsp:Transcript_29848/g.85438  ORF Transcript_29848/g.85438 Transcript_29848/m.85438 type:complete len:517 (-) Transcript_29848:237-1787(-)
MAATLREEPLLQELGEKLVPTQEQQSPRRAYTILAFCTALQFLVYADRGIIAGLLKDAEAEFSINKFQSGLLGTIFLAGFMLMSPVAAAAAGEREGGMRTIGAGLTVWTFAVLLCSGARTYTVLLLARALAGCGEAALCSLAPPLLDDAAPPGKKSGFLALYFSAIFVGLGFGFAITGFATSWADGSVIFAAEGLVMAPLCVISLCCGSSLMVGKAQGCLDVEHLLATVPACTSAHSSFPKISGNSSLSSAHEDGRIERKTTLEGITDAMSMQHSAPLLVSSRSGSLVGAAGQRVAGQLQDWRTRTGASILEVLQSDVYTLLVLGYCATIFTIGGIAFWAPSYLGEVLGEDTSTASGVLGVITGLTGLSGTTLGGLLLDAAANRYGKRRLQAARLCFACVVLASPVTMVTAGASSRTLFFSSLALGQLLIFAATAPANIAMMEAVPPSQRGLALGLCTLASHLLGDLIPPVLVGHIADVTGSLRVGMWLLVLWLLWSVLFWFLALIRTRDEVAKWR